MTKPTIAELQHEFDKRLKLYTGKNEVSDLWLPYVYFFQSKADVFDFFSSKVSGCYTRYVTGR
jgi:hypothetical protein